MYSQAVKSHLISFLAQRSTSRHITAQHSTAQHSTAQHSTAQHSTAQHSTTYHDTTDSIDLDRNLYRHAVIITQ